MKKITYTGKLPNSFHLSSRLHKRVFPNLNPKTVRLFFAKGNTTMEIEDYLAEYFVDLGIVEYANKEDRTTYNKIMDEFEKDRSLVGIAKLNKLRKMAKEFGLNIKDKKLDEIIDEIRKLDELHD